jgi:hypothetical protein
MSDNVPRYPDGQLAYPFSTGSGDDLEFFYVHPDTDEGRQLIAQGIQLPPLSAYYMVNMFPTPLHGPAGTQRPILSPTPSTPEEDATPLPSEGLSQNVVSTVHTGDEESVQGDSDNAKLGGPVATHIQKTKGKEKTESLTSFRAKWTSSDLVLLARTVSEVGPYLVSRGDEGKSWATVRDKVVADETYSMRDTDEKLDADEFRLKTNALVSYYKVC